MAQTLVEYAKGMDDMKARAIVMMFSQASDILGVIPFQTAPGGSYRYLEEAKLPNVAFRAINAAPTSSRGVMNERTESVYPLAGNLDVDRAILRRHGMERRSREEEMQIKRKSAVWTTTFIAGNNATTPTEFTGLQNRLKIVNGSIDGTDRRSRVIVNNNASGGGALSLSKLDRAITMTAKGGTETVLIMSPLLKDRFIAAERNTSVTGQVIRTTNESGTPVTRYGGYRILTGYEATDEHDGLLPFTEVGNGGGAAVTTSIYVVTFGEGFVSGLQTAPMEVTDYGLLEDGATFRTNIEHDVGMAVEHGYAATRLSSITDAAIVA